MATGFLHHELYLWHNTQNWAELNPPGLTVQPGTHAENPETKRRFRNLVEVSGLLDQMTVLKPRPATEDEIARFHTRDLIADIKAKSRGGYAVTEDGSPMGRGTFEIAQLSAGGSIVALEAVLSGNVKNAYALVRPPGHHATRTTAMGFCFFANAVIAILHARAVHGVTRVATVDWDVHHGNGTQSAFYDDPNVLTISLHQDNLFPQDSGTLVETGRGAGLGACLNIPLPAGSGNGAYLAAIQQVVVPALEKFKPEVIIVPSGFDASGADPLGRQMVSSTGFRGMTKMLMQAADTLSGGRLMMTHEGGYSAHYVPYCGLAVLEEMSGIKTNVEDPWADSMDTWGGQTLQPHQAAVITEAARLVARIP